VVVGGRVVVVVGACVVVVGGRVVVVVVGACVVVVVVGACVVVVVVGACVVVVVVGACVVVVVVGACVVVVVVVDVVVVLGGVIERPHPIALQSCGPASLQIDAPLGSNRLVIASPIEAGVAAATALKVTRATLTTPVGAVRLLVWNAVNFV